MITNGKVVALSYTLKNNNGEVLDQASKDDPFYYLHGHGQIVPGLEMALTGLNVGDAKEVVVAPEQGYGLVVDDLKISVRRQQFPKEADIQIGMQFLAETGEGQKHPFTVMKIAGEDIHLDGNHPLAGQTLHFSLAVESVRDATAEEQAHGHAHGPGGHHHHHH